MTPERWPAEKIAALILDDIGDIDEASTWVAVVLAESGGDPVAYNLVDEDPASRAYLSTDNGLFQINSYWHGNNIPVHEANRPALAWAYSLKIATGDGQHSSDWSPWNVYRSGAYLNQFDIAQNAVIDTIPEGEPVADILDLPIPAAPDYYGPDGAPPGVAVQLDAFGAWAAGRPKITPRVGVVHTNAASVESTLQGQINWGNASANNTKPHYCVNAPQPTKVLRTDRRAIANSTGSAVEQQYNERDSSFWTIAIETADTGTKADPAISDFLTTSKHGPVPVPHAEIVARIIAYESIVWDIPIEVPDVWNATGWVTHTWPFPYPYFTTKNGKTCPGAKKKLSFRDTVVARARKIQIAWLTPVEPLDPEPPKDEPMFRYRNTKYLDQFAVGASGAIKMTQTAVKIPQFANLALVENDDREFLAICCRNSGFDFADLTPA